MAMTCNIPGMNLAQVRRVALGLPEVIESPHFASTSFRVAGKIIATAPPSGEHLHVFIDEEQRQRALALAPEFLSKLWWGKKVLGLRVELCDATPSVVAGLLEQAWVRRAPKALAGARESPGRTQPRPTSGKPGSPRRRKP